MSNSDVLDPNLPASWQLKDNYMVGMAWLSRRNERRAAAERLALEFVAMGEEVPSVVKLELSKESNASEYEGWHHLFMVQMASFYEGFAALTQGVKTLFKRGELDAGSFEFLLSDVQAPVRLSKSQRVMLIDTFMKGVKGHTFSEDEEGIFEMIVPFGDYALRLGVEYARIRDTIDGHFEDADNPLRSLVGVACHAYAWTFEAQDEDEAAMPTVGEGVLELDGHHVRIGEWQHTFEADDLIIDSAAFEEVTIRSEALELDITITPQTPIEAPPTTTHESETRHE